MRAMGRIMFAAVKFMPPPQFRRLIKSKYNIDDMTTKQSNEPFVDTVMRGGKWLSAAH